MIYGHNHGYCTNPASDAYKVKDCPNCEFGTNDNNIGCNDVTPDFSKAGDPTGSTVCGFSSIIWNKKLLPNTVKIEIMFFI